MDENFNADNLFGNNAGMYEEPRVTKAPEPKEVQQEQQPVKQQQVKNDTDQKVAFGYTREQWVNREIMYVNKLNQITLPPDIKPSDIQRAALQIDELLTAVHIDDYKVQQKLQVYQQQLKVMERSMYTSVKNAGGATKLTVSEVESLVVQKIQNSPWDNTKFSLYTLINEYTMRSIFTTSMIKVLSEKKDFLITHSGILKIETSVGNFSGNVPQNIPSQGYNANGQM